MLFQRAEESIQITVITEIVHSNQPLKPPTETLNFPITKITLISTIEINLLLKLK
jgi:hypothetical protein